MGYDPSLDDMAAIIDDGDLVEYLLSTAGRTRKRPKNQPAADTDQAVARAPFHSPLHRPGAWPAGTRPAGPNTCDPDCDCALNKPPRDGRR